MTMLTRNCRCCGKEFARRAMGRTHLFCSQACAQSVIGGRDAGTGDARLRATERLVKFYAADCALCSCPGTTHGATGLPCIRVGRDRAAGADRCLECGESWTVREYRWQTATKIASAA